MLGIQRLFGPNSSEAKTEPAKLASQNKHLNGNAYKYTSASYFNSMAKMRLHEKLMKKMRDLYNFFILQISYCKGTFPILHKNRLKEIIK